MAVYSSEPDFTSEPKRRFYPNQDTDSQPRRVPGPFAAVTPQPVSPSFPSPYTVPTRKKSDDAAYLMHRHPILLQRLYQAADSLLDGYRTRDFIYDAYPDYRSLGWMRDRLLRENPALTEAFLREGCPAEWLNLLTDTVLSELLCRKRCSQRNPRGDARTTSVTSASRS